MTDKQIAQLVTDSTNAVRDLLYANLAHVEIRLHAIENILNRKEIIVSREQIENEQQSIGKAAFERYVRTYDELASQNYATMLEIRSKQR